MAEKTARDFLSSEYYAARIYDTVAEALDRLRNAPPKARALYLYVTDDAGALVGVVPVRKLITSAAGARVADIMSPRTIKLPLDAPESLVRDFFATYQFLSIPVVDAAGRLMGVVPLDAVSEVFAAGESEEEIEGRVRADVFHLLGLETEELSTRSAWRGARLRFPYLIANIAGGLAAALVTGVFRTTLEKVLALAFFVPVTLGLAESVGMQTTAVVVSGLKGRGATPPLSRLVARQVAEAMLLGLLAGAVVGGIAWAWLGNERLALVVVVTVALTCATAAGLACGVPVLFRRLGLDPALGSAPLVLAVSDILTLLGYLSLARHVIT